MAKVFQHPIANANFKRLYEHDLGEVVDAVQPGTYCIYARGRAGIVHDHTSVMDPEALISVRAAEVA